jgi:hypothetical protein
LVVGDWGRDIAVPAPREVDVADDVPMAVGGGRGGGEWGAKMAMATATAEQPPIGRGGWQQQGDCCRGDDRCLNDYPIEERERTMHHWKMVRGRGSGGWVTNVVR